MGKDLFIGPLWAFGCRVKTMFSNVLGMKPRHRWKCGSRKTPRMEKRTEFRPWFVKSSFHYRMLFIKALTHTLVCGLLELWNI